MKELWRYYAIHDPLDTFACTAVLKYSDISRFMAKLVASHPISRGDVRHNTIISSFGEAINISSVSVAGRATRFKLPVIVFHHFDCHVY